MSRRSLAGIILGLSPFHFCRSSSWPFLLFMDPGTLTIQDFNEGLWFTSALLSDRYSATNLRNCFGSSLYPLKLDVSTEKVNCRHWLIDMVSTAREENSWFPI